MVGMGLGREELHYASEIGSNYDGRVQNGKFVVGTAVEP